MSAKKEFLDKEAEIKGELVLLKKLLINHKKAFNKDEKNWGYVGSLGYILQELKNLNSFLIG